MIIPMKKYSFLIYHKDYIGFLKELQGVGVLDIIERDVELDEGTREKYVRIQQYKNRISLLNRRKVEQHPLAESDLPAEDILRTMDIMEAEQEQLRLRMNTLRKESDNVTPWGEFSVESIKRLLDYGIEMKFFNCQERKFDPAWNERHYVFPIGFHQSQLFFVLFHKGDEDIAIDAEEVRMPDRPLSQINLEKETIEKRMADIEMKFDEYAEQYLALLEKQMKLLEHEADFFSAQQHTLKEAGDRLVILEGWVPKNTENELKDFLEQKGVVYIATKPVPGDKIPILLKNNRFARLFEPIGNLFSLPDYQELDLTPYFAPFFMMFFGFCLGDAGYGIVLLALGTFAKFKVKKSMKPILSLVQWLGLGTIIFGILTGTFFGISLLHIESLGSIRNIMFNNEKTFYLALGIGLFQVLFGTAIRAINQIRQYGWAYGMPSIGWILLVIGMLDHFLLKIAGIISVIVLFTGVAMIVFFSNPKAGILGRIGKGLWDLYGVTGIFGDVLSYIRLFALGVSSSILGFVINDIALQIKGAIPVLGPILFVIFLLIGHFANLLISSLGSFVHPMRLTFVEFYKNAGFSGGGKKYKPFTNKS